MTNLNEKALAKVQDKYADENGKYRDISIREIITAYLEALPMHRDTNKSIENK